VPCVCIVAILMDSSGKKSVVVHRNKASASSPSHTNDYMEPPCSVIYADSETGVALQDRTKTAYVFENQYRVLSPGDVHEYIATVGILNCVTLIVNVPGGFSLLGHITKASVFFSLDEAIFMKRNGGALQNMVDTLKTTFLDQDVASISASLVGGWKRTDMEDVLKDKYFPTRPNMWTLSGVLLDCIQRALPGVKTDVSRLNSCAGVSWEDRTVDTKLRAVSDGEAFRVVVMNKDTGLVEAQSTSVTDVEGGECVTVAIPSSVIMDTLVERMAMQKRADVFGSKWPHGCIPPPLLEEYVEPKRVHLEVEECVEPKRVRWTL
jgi:hypothetical protein